MSAFVIAAASYVGDGDGRPPQLDVLPSRLRRGLSQHQRAVVDVVARLTSETDRATLRIVHGSELGELETAVALASSDAPSPARFSLSVHSSVVGLLSIAFGNRRGHLTLSAGVDTLAACVVDACALLQAGEPEVLVVVADETCASLPGGPERLFAFGFRLAHEPGASARGVTLDASVPGPASETLFDACVRLERACREGGVVPSGSGFPGLRVSGGPA